jgi:hypothetical protein
MTMTPVIDADAYVTEPPDVWSSRLPKRCVIDDAAANGAMLSWALDRLRHHLGEMLAGAGAEPDMVSVDGDRAGHLVDQVASLATA